MVKNYKHKDKIITVFSVHSGTWYFRYFKTLSVFLIAFSKF